MIERRDGSSLLTLTRALIPFMRASPSLPYPILVTSLRSHLLIPITWQVELEHRNFQGDTNIQSVTVPILCTKSNVIALKETIDFNHTFLIKLDLGNL